MSASRRRDATFQINADLGSITVVENRPMALLAFHLQLLSVWPRAGSALSRGGDDLLGRVGMVNQARRGCGFWPTATQARLKLAVALANHETSSDGRADRPELRRRANRAHGV